MSDIPKAKVVWKEHDIDDIIRYFAKDFSVEKNNKILGYHYMIDTYLRKVVFQITIETKP